jgi:hypothetical protein
MKGPLTDGTTKRRHAVPAVVSHFDAETPHVLAGSMRALFSGAWKKRFRTARWRGVPFYTSEHDSTFGRRIQLFEYAQRDTPYAEDLGRTARQFRLRGYLVGGDYMGLRDRLRAACEASGPGQLVHPYLGTFTVVCTAVRIRESEQQGGFCVLDFDFTEAGTMPLPFGASLLGGMLVSAGSALAGAAVDAFSTGFATQGFSSWVSKSALSSLHGLSQTLHGMQGFAGLGGASLGGSIGLPFAAPSPAAVPAAGSALDALDALTEADLDAPASIAQQVIDAIAALTAASWPETALANLEQLFLYTVPPLPGPPQPPITPDRLQEQVNATALAALVHQAAAAALPGPITGLSPTSYDALAAARLDLLDDLDDLQAEATDPVYLALRDLTAAISAQMTAQGASLRPLILYRTALPRPALVLAQRFYQDFTRADEIVTLTQAAHPGFLPTQGLIASA